MSAQMQPVSSPSQFVCLLRRYPRRWLVPALVVVLAAGLYALVRPDKWEASQALIIRNEAANNEDRPGKFSHSEEMKTAQETIIELAKSQSVLAAALREVGPPAGRKRPKRAWPSQRDVVKLQEAVKLLPPKGAEFGTTEVFYLRVRDSSRQRALALVSAICDQLEARYQQLRDAKARSMIDELAKAVKLARQDLAQSTARLAEIEQEVGSDLAELRSLEDWGTGESALRRTIAEIRGELRQAQAAQQSSRELLALLEDARQDPSRLVATPSRLFQSQPSLKRLKDGLVDAQLRTAELAGRMSQSHPLVQAAKQSERQIAQHLRNELDTAIRGVQLDLRLSAQRIAMLESQLEAATGRLKRLAALRAQYANLVAETRNRSLLLERAEQKLADARVSQAGAKAASLIGRIDSPQVGIHPVGPGRATIVLAGIVGGLLAGLASLLLTTDLAEPAPVWTEPIAAGVLPRRLHQGNGRTQAARPAGALSFKQALQRIAASTSGNR